VQPPELPVFSGPTAASVAASSSESVEPVPSASASTTPSQSASSASVPPVIVASTSLLNEPPPPPPQPLLEPGPPPPQPIAKGIKSVRGGRSATLYRPRIAPTRRRLSSQSRDRHRNGCGNARTFTRSDAQELPPSHYGRHARRPAAYGAGPNPRGAGGRVSRSLRNKNRHNSPDIKSSYTGSTFIISRYSEYIMYCSVKIMSESAFLATRKVEKATLPSPEVKLTSSGDAVSGKMLVPSRYSMFPVR
jgi:hypothetical protein